MEAAVLYCVHKYAHVYIYIYMCSVWVEDISSNFRCLVCCSVDLLLSQWEEISTYREYLLAVSFSSISCLNLPYKQFRIDNFWLKLGEMNHTRAHKALLLPPVYTIKLHPSCWNKNSRVSPKISSRRWMDWILAQEFKGRFDRLVNTVVVWRCGLLVWVRRQEPLLNHVWMPLKSLFTCEGECHSISFI